MSVFRRWSLASILVVVTLLIAARVNAELTSEACIEANETAQLQIQNGELLAADKNLRQCVSSGCPGPIRAHCQQLTSELLPRIPSLHLSVEAEDGSPINEVTIKIDGQTLPAPQASAAVSLDPGSHSIEVGAPGFELYSTTVTLAEGEKEHEHWVTLQRPTPPGSHMRRLGLGIMGGGALAGLVGGYYGVRAKLTYNDARSECTNPPNGCSTQALHREERARSQASISTKAFIFALVLIGGGGTLYYLAPVAVEPVVDTAGVGLRIGGRF